MIFSRVFIPFAIGYLLSYILRVVNAVIAPDLIADLDLDASDLGLLTSASFFAFAAFQLPLGILLDRYGPRKTESALLILACVGCAMFALAQSLETLIVARALIGLGTSACLMAAFTAYALWLPKERLPSINSYQMVAGGLGALVGTVPVEIAAELYGWRGVFWILSASVLAVALLLFVMVPRRNDPTPGTQHWRDAMAGVRAVFVSPTFWRVAPICVVSQGTFIGIQSLWLGPWFHDVMQMAPRETADALFLVAAAMVASYLILAWVTTAAAKLGYGPIQVSIFGMAVFLGIQVLMLGGILPWAVWSWMLWSFFGTYGIASYAGLTQAFPTQLAGRVVTGINVLAFLAAFAVQWGVGAIIDLWPRTETGGFAPVAYTWAFTVLAGLQIAGLAWFILSPLRRSARSPS